MRHAKDLPGNDITVRYLKQVLRWLPPEQVCAQILTGFELASADARVVGLNLVMPENCYVPIRVTTMLQCRPRTTPSLNKFPS
jgi:hypothetical protein